MALTLQQAIDAGAIAAKILRVQYQLARIDTAIADGTMISSIVIGFIDNSSIPWTGDIPVNRGLSILNGLKNIYENVLSDLQADLAIIVP